MRSQRPDSRAGRSCRIVFTDPRRRRPGAGHCGPTLARREATKVACDGVADGGAISGVISALRAFSCVVMAAAPPLGGNAYGPSVVGPFDTDSIGFARRIPVEGAAFGCSSRHVDTPSHPLSTRTGFLECTRSGDFGIYPHAQA